MRMPRGIVGRDGRVVRRLPLPDCAAPLTKLPLESGRGIERSRAPESAQHCTALAPEDPARHSRRILADLPLYWQSARALHPRWRDPYPPAVARQAPSARCRVPRRHHQRHRAPPAHVGRKPRCRQSARCPLRALRLVVLRLQLVDRVSWNHSAISTSPGCSVRCSAGRRWTRHSCRCCWSDSGDEARRSGPVVAPSSRMALRFPGSARREPKTPARPRCCRPRCSRLTRAQIRAGNAVPVDVRVLRGNPVTELGLKGALRAAIVPMTWGLF